MKMELDSVLVFRICSRTDDCRNQRTFFKVVAW